MRKSKLFAALAAMLALSFTALSCSSESGGEASGNVTKGSYPVRSVTAGATSASVVFAWAKPSDTSNYGGVKITWGSKREIVDSSKTSYTVTGLSASTPYTFKLTTLDKNKSETSSSVSLSITTPAAQTAAGDDTIAPANVTDVSATGLDGAVLLKWTDPTDSDLFGIQITYTENSASRAVAAMEAGSIFVAPGTQAATVTGLVNGISYIFTLKAMDTSGNTSDKHEISASPSVVQGNPMKIALTPGTTETTNQNVTVGIAITTDASSVTTVKYASGEQNVSYFASSGGTTLSADDNGAYSFAASESGAYTVYALDSDGRRETQAITISNIDKTAPEAVSNLYASYDNSTKKITVTWTTADSDIDHYLVSYSVGDEVKVTDESVSGAAYTVESVVQDSGTYTFTVKAVDKAGNIGKESTASVTLVSLPYISKITLDRKHIAYNTANKTINVTVQGGNFGLIESQDDATLKVQLVGPDGVLGTVEATVNTSNDTATAVVTVPDSALSSSTTITGTDYTIRAKVCGTIDTDHTATLNISDAASVSSISLSTEQISADDVISSTTTTATVSGTNFDVAGVITLQLYGSTGASYGDAVAVEASGFEMHETGFTAEIPVPTVDDMYTLKVLLDGTAQSKTTTLQVYGAPTFTSFTIPNAGTSKEDNTVTATVKGKNFTAPNITSSSFKVTCADKPSIASGAVVTVQDDSTLKIALNIPGADGVYAVTVASGKETKAGTFTVKDYSTYTAGKIVLADGKLVDPSSYTEIASSNPPVAVVAGFNKYGVALGVGLHTSYLQWAPSGTTGYNTRFTDIVCTPSDYGSSGTASTATFTGDTDGSDNWSVICSVDPEGSADAATNYPAFNWANTYGTKYADKLGSATDGWYMPSLAELCYVYRNRETINATLSAINGIDSSYAQSSLGTSYFWSSSQDSNGYYFACYVDFSYGYVYYSSVKYDNLNVLVVRAF